MEPGGFALVMATGIVSIDATQHALPAIGRVLFGLNWLAYLWLLSISALRFALYRDEMIRNFQAPRRGAAFLTLPAATCVLATQCLEVVYLPGLARALAIWGALSWLILIYLFFFSAITRRDKARFSETIDGSWLVAVVSTQALAVAVAVLARDGAPSAREGLLFVGTSLYLIGCAWYLTIITLIIYRMVLLPLHAEQFTPPYWINMGALAISALAGSLIILNAPAQGPLRDLVPFVKGFALFYWATATWWIPLLVMLELWRYVWGHIPVDYEVDEWDIVFPIGMYTVCTTAVAHAIGADYLRVIPDVGVYVSILVWAVVGVGLGWRLARRARTPKS